MSFTLPLKVGCLFSGGASAMKYLVKNDPNYGITYKFVGAFTNNKNAGGIDWCFNNRLPYRLSDNQEFAKKYQYPSWKELSPPYKKIYFDEVAVQIRRFDADILLCAGFMLVIKDRLLQAYRGRIINVHPADLSVMFNGRRKYIGAYAVRDAINDEQIDTRSTIHVVTDEIDGGPIICMSNPLHVKEEDDWKTHQEKMKIFCDGPAYVKALKLITSGVYKLPI